MDDFTKKALEFIKPVDITEDFEEKDIKQQKSIAAMCYLPLFFIIAFVGFAESKYAKFHAKQGTLIFILEVLFIVPLNKCRENGNDVLAGLFGFLTFIVVIYVVMGIVYTIKEKAVALPLIGKLLVVGRDNTKPMF